MKKDTNIKVKDRREGITRIANKQGYASIDYLADYYQVSTQTIRWDILILSKENLVTRHHGVCKSYKTVPSIPISYLNQHHPYRKTRGGDKLHPDVFLLREYQKINIF